MPARPSHRYTWRQPYACVSHAISGENTTAAKYCAELKIADAVPRSAVGNQLATTFAFAGNAGASAMPTAKRIANSAATASAALPPSPIVLCSSVNADHRKMLPAYTRRAPKRSSSQPLGSCASTYAQLNAEKM